jgi:amino acid adenylation domain-containing protein
MNQKILDNIEDAYPLSPVQRGMLFHSLERPEDQMYFFQVVLKISGDVDLDSFQQAWQKLIDRHAILRTAFVWKNLAQPLQVVQRRVTLPIEVRNEMPRDPALWKQERDEFLRYDRERGLQLTRAPLMRLTVLRMPEECFTVVWSFHHLIADAWSQSLLLGNLFQLYEACRSGAVVSLPQTANFRSYIEWLESRRSTEESFWRQRLAGADLPSKLRIHCAPDFAPDAPRSQRQVHRSLSPEYTKKLRQFCQRRRVTLNTVVQAAWSVLVGKYSGANDVTFGVTVAIRPPDLPGSESIIGPLINTVPMRVRIEPKEPVGEFLQSLQDQGADLLEQAAASLTNIRQWAGLSGPANLFETIIVFENTPFDAVVAAKVKNLCHDWECIEPVNYELALKVLPSERLSFTLAYDTTKLSHAFAERLLSQIVSLLEQISSHPDGPVGNLYLAKEFNPAGIVRGPAEREGTKLTAQMLFDAAVQKAPQAVAIETDGHKMSYSGVDGLATSLADHMRLAGVGPEVPVAVCLPRGRQQVIAALAAWKAGGVYSPMDPAAPDDRISFQLRNLNPGVILCRAAESDRFALAGRILTIDDIETPVFNGTVREEKSRTVLEDEALSGAYIIHTSGSTGRPKGVVVSHSGMENLVRSQIERLEAGPGARVLQFASPAFDASVFEIALALFSGATLVQAPENELLLGTGLVEFLKGAAVTHAVLTPSLLMALPDADLPALRVLVVAGEACSQEVGRRWGRGRRVFNAYGPTEATIWSTVSEVAPGQAVTIGRPIHGVRAHIADLHGQMVPPEVVGDLVLGGPSIARGYLNSPVLTAERFIPDDQGDSPGARLYRTGDLACYTEGGEIDFCGRADRQIKLRGYRIEIEEIESVLREHTAVVAAAVVLVPEGNSKILAAYAVLRSDAEVDAIELKAWLAKRLPEYSVPAHIFITSQLPLTHTGKLDRERLIQSVARMQVVQDHDSEGLPLVALLMRYWKDITGLPGVSCNASLFDQAGDSLRLMDLIGRIGEELRVEVPLGQLFDAPTITALADYLLQNSHSEELNRIAQEKLKPQEECVRPS